MKADKSLLYACVINDLPMIKERVSNASPAQLNKRTQQDGTPLHAASLHENREAVELLLAAGADIEAGNFLGNNAMLTCIAEGKLAMARYLIEKGSDINKKGCQSRHALNQLICYSWDRDFAHYLLSQGCDINQTSRDKYDLLNIAACNNNTDALDFLLSNGINQTGIHSALCWGILKNSVEAVSLLLQRGASLTAMYPELKGLEKGVYHQAAVKESGEAMLALLSDAGIDFSLPPERAVVVGLEKTKLSPLEYAKAQLTAWPQSLWLNHNIKMMASQST